VRSLAAQTRVILRNDLRLLWRDLAASRWKNYLSLSLVVVLFLIANAVSIGVFFAIHEPVPLGFESLAWLFFGFMMLGAAMNQAIRVLFERADFDLLLSAPVSPRAILLARLAVMTTGAGLSVALFLLPVVDGAMLALSWGYAFGWLVWALLSCAVASAGVWFTLMLVQWLGPRRARIWAQVAAAVVGAGVYLAFQGHNMLPDPVRDWFGTTGLRLLSHPAIAWVARAGRGEFLPLLLLVAVSGGFATATTRLLSRMFIGGIQEAGGIAPSRKKETTARHVFAAGVERATFWKDLRIIMRDPLLLAQILPTALYILPGIFSFYRFGGIALLAPLTLFLTGQFSVGFVHAAVAGEECWDLIQMSPTRELRLRVAKMAAGMALPAGLCVVLCAILIAIGRPGLALVTLIFSLACAAGCSWLSVTQIRPTPRRDLFKRGQGGRSIGRNLVTSFILILGAGGLGFAASTHWIVSTIFLGATTLALIGCFTLTEMEEIPGSEFVPDPAAKA
jgi:ABC-2 type transport system permease protein